MDGDDLFEAVRQVGRALHVDPSVLGLTGTAIGGAALALYIRRRLRGVLAMNTSSDNAANSGPPESVCAGASTAHDGKHRSQGTILLLPDISGYTRFLAAGGGSSEVLHSIVLRLLEAMIAAVRRRLVLVKMQGDALLFVSRSDGLCAADLTDVIHDIYAAFDHTLRDLRINGDFGPPIGLSLSELDLKIIVHKGTATWFEFRNTIDVTGPDVVTIHRLAKNKLEKKRYIMITSSARANMIAPRDWEVEQHTMDIGELGSLDVAVFEIPKRRFLGGGSQRSDPRIRSTLSVA